MPKGNPQISATSWLKLLQSWILIALGVTVAAHTSEGIHYDGLPVLVLVVLVVSVLNLFLRPLLVLFTLPFIILTFGFGLVLINALIIYFAGALIPGFEVESFLSALWAAIVIALVTLIVNLFIGSTRVQISRSGRPPRGGGGGPRKDQDVIDI